MFFISSFVLSSFASHSLYLLYQHTPLNPLSTALVLVADLHQLLDFGSLKMPSTSAAFFSLALLLPCIVSAANDWTKPCHDGTCAYDLHNHTSPHGVAGGSLYLVRTLWSDIHLNWALRYSRCPSRMALPARRRGLAQDCPP